jgi:hypothetical protein
MVADHAYSPGSLPFMDRRARLFYFATAVPAVGFMHGSADVSPLNEAMLESYPEGSFPWQAKRAGRVTQESAVAGDYSGSCRARSLVEDGEPDHGARI